MWQNNNQPQQQFPPVVQYYPSNPQQQQQGLYLPQPVPRGAIQLNQGYQPAQQHPPNPYNPQQTFSMSQAPPYADPEDPNSDNFTFDDQSIRKGFIRKVFAILTAQLLVTVGVISLFVFHAPTIQFVQRNQWIWWASLITVLVVMIVLACCENMRRKTPMNFILLAVFTAAKSLMLGVVTANFAREEVIMAVGITAFITFALTLFAFQTKWDFTAMGSILFIGIIILFILAIFAVIFQDRTLTLVYASLGAFLFCIYLVYDIQLMMGGKHKYSISPEEYIFAALNLYLDIVNIFIYILMIIGAARN